VRISMMDILTAANDQRPTANDRSVAG